MLFVPFITVFFQLASSLLQPYVAAAFTQGGLLASLALPAMEWMVLVLALVF